MSSATAATTRTVSATNGPTTAAGPKPHWPAASLLPVMNAMEAKIKRQLFLSDTTCHPRGSPHRHRPFPFLSLPAEIREKIYSFVWGIELDYYFSIYICYPSINIRRVHDRGLRGSRGAALLLVNKQLGREAASVLYSHSVLSIESFPCKRPPDTLPFIGSIRTNWFINATRSLCIKSSFGFVEKQNEAWVKALKCFRALQSLEVLLHMEGWLREEALKDVVPNLLPFTALKCKAVTFRGSVYVPEENRGEVEAAWRDAFVAKAGVAPLVTIAWDYHERSRI